MGEVPRLSLIALNEINKTGRIDDVPDPIVFEEKANADKVIKKGLLKGWRKHHKPLREQITFRDGNLMTPTAMRKQLRKYYEGINDDHHFYHPGALTFLINLKNTREKNYTDGFAVPLIHDHEEVDEFFRGLHVDYERLINDTINEMTKDELIKFYNNVFFNDEMLRSDIPKEDVKHITNPRYFNQGQVHVPVFAVDGALAAKKGKKGKKTKKAKKEKKAKKGKKGKGSQKNKCI